MQVENLQAVPLTHHMNKEIVRDIMREMAEGEKRRTRSKSPRLPRSKSPHSRQRGKSPGGKVVRKKLVGLNESAHSQRLKVRIVKKHRNKPEEVVPQGAAQLQIADATASNICVEYCKTGDTVEVSS